MVYNHHLPKAVVLKKNIYRSVLISKIEHHWWLWYHQLRNGAFKNTWPRWNHLVYLTESGTSAGTISTRETNEGGRFHFISFEFWLYCSLPMDFLIKVLFIVFLRLRPMRGLKVYKRFSLCRPIYFCFPKKNRAFYWGFAAVQRITSNWMCARANDADVNDFSRQGTVVKWRAEGLQ